MSTPENEYIAAICSAELFKFCRENELPYLQAYELSLLPDLTDFQFGFLVAYGRIMKALIQ